MKRALSIQRNKLMSAYGGVGSLVDTIENLSLQVLPVEKWNIYKSLRGQITNGTTPSSNVFNEVRLSARLRSIGFTNLRLDHPFFQLDDFADDINEYSPTDQQVQRMVNTQFFPGWFFCPKCNRLKPYADWEKSWILDTKWDARPPKCSNDARRVGNKVYAAELRQMRFALASMETGELRDIPWNQIVFKKGVTDGPNVWKFPIGFATATDLYYYTSKDANDLFGLHITDKVGHDITMAEVMKNFFIIEESPNHWVAYKPIVRSANNVYYAYTLSSVFVPTLAVTQNDIVIIQNTYNVLNNMGVPNINADKVQQTILANSQNQFGLTAAQIQQVIDNNFQMPRVSYDSEEEFRMEEYDVITDINKYVFNAQTNNSIYKPNDRLTSILYNWQNPKPNRITNIFYQPNLSITTTQVAYSRIDSISSSYLQNPNWEGQSDSPKWWYDVARDTTSQNIPVKLHPTCNNIKTIDMMPAVQSFGEGFFVELNLSDIPKDHRLIYLHTYCHAIMKELEFACGYPLASMNERLYFLPKELTNVTCDKYGFLIYAIGGGTGSYGGITSLFYSQKIEDILANALKRANDCPNDPICEEERGHCFACVDIPETACELFNSKLDRRVLIDPINYTIRTGLTTTSGIQLPMQNITPSGCWPSSKAFHKRHIIDPACPIANLVQQDKELTIEETEEEPPFFKQNDIEDPLWWIDAGPLCGESEEEYKNRRQKLEERFEGESDEDYWKRMDKIFQRNRGKEMEQYLLDDVLGLYISQRVHIKLFMRGIRKLAGELGIPVENVKNVVLNHELGHWKSHRVSMGNTKEWPLDLFVSSETIVKEIIAQLYAEKYSQPDDFKAVCSKQDGEYLAFRAYSSKSETEIENAIEKLRSLSRAATKQDWIQSI